MSDCYNKKGVCTTSLGTIKGVMALHRTVDEDDVKAYLDEVLMELKGKRNQEL